MSETLHLLMPSYYITFNPHLRSVGSATLSKMSYNETNFTLG